MGVTVTSRRIWERFGLYVGSGFLFPAATQGNFAVLLRRVVGVISLWLLIGASALLEAGGAKTFLLIVVGGCLAFSLIAGFLLPLSIPLLLMFLAIFARDFSFWSLGVEAMQWALVALVIYPSKSTNDLDALFMRGGSPLGVLLSKIYKYWCINEDVQLVLARWFSLFLFSITAFYSVGLHGRDAFWQSGLIGPYLLVNNYMSRFYSFHEEVFSQSSFLIAVVGGLSTAFIYIFGLFWLLMFFRGRIVAVIIRVASGSFFLFSIINLNLGVLPFVEVFLWVFWFLPRSRSKPEDTTSPVIFMVFYDDMCRICQGTRRLYGRLDSTHVVLWAPVSKSSAVLESIGISREAATVNITAIRSDGQLISGYEFYQATALYIPLLAPLTPLLHLGSWSRLGPMVYRYVQTRRRRREEYCELTPAEDHTNSYERQTQFFAIVDRLPSHSQRRERITWLSAFTLALTLSASFYLVTTPVILSGLGVEDPVSSPVSNFPNILGLNPIDVFNSNDLRLGENWVVFYEGSIHPRNRLSLTNEDGSRSPIQVIDALVYGGTLPQARLMINLSNAERCDSLGSYADNDKIRGALKLIRVQPQRPLVAALYQRGLPYVNAAGVLEWHQRSPVLVCYRIVE